MNKILIINTEYREFGGEDSNIVDEVAVLSKHYEVEYINFSNKGRLNIIDFFSFFLRSNISSNKEIIKKIKEFGPDIVYIHNLWFKGNLGFIKKLLKKNIKIVLKIHNFRFDCAKSFLLKKHLNGNEFCYKCGIENKHIFLNKYFKNSYLKSILLIWFNKKYLSIINSEHINLFVLNNFYKEFLEGAGFQKDRIFISHNPIFLKNNISYNFNSSYVIYAGALTKEKGIIELVKYWHESKIKCKLYIAGTGNLKNQITQLARNNVQFLDELPHNQVLKLIEESKAVITATKMYEGQPRLFFEAMCNGVPIIYPSFGGLDEYFPPDYSLAFKQYDYIDFVNKIKLLENKNLLEHESERLFKNFEQNFQEEKIIDNFNVILNNET